MVAAGPLVDPTVPVLRIVVPCYLAVNAPAPDDPVVGTSDDADRARPR